jgi:lipopolysaccharide/colanic/teichoic acid biosynthesis glycosyltransferase
VVVSVAMRGGQPGSEPLFPASPADSAENDDESLDGSVDAADGEAVITGELTVEAISYEMIVAQYSRAALAVKRALDVAFAGLGLLLAAPLLAVLAVLIRLDSRGPVLFRQPRVGKRESPFMIVKLRTMDADGQVTRVGRFLRPMGLDEIPQLWNVLKGDMSVIGPRPELLHWWPAWQDFPGHDARHLMRPGITGWAQVNGLRGKVPLGDRLRFDLAYTRSWSLGLDWRILMRTLTTVWADTRKALRS